MKGINVPLSQIDFFVVGPKNMKIRFTRRVESPYHFYVTWYTFKTVWDFLRVYARCIHKWGEPEITEMMSGRLLYTWKLD